MGALGPPAIGEKKIIGKKGSQLASRALGTAGRVRARVISLQLCRLSRVWLGAVVLVAFLALWAIQGFGEVVMWREIPVHGQNLADQLAQPVAEMKQQLTSLGCNQFSVAYWSVDIPTRFRVEVRCRERMSDVPLDRGGLWGGGPIGTGN